VCAVYDDTVTEFKVLGLERCFISKHEELFLISNFRLVLNVLCFLHSRVGTFLPAYEDGTDRVFQNVGTMIPRLTSDPANEFFG